MQFIDFTKFLRNFQANYNVRVHAYNLLRWCIDFTKEMENREKPLEHLLLFGQRISYVNAILI